VVLECAWNGPWRKAQEAAIPGTHAPTVTFGQKNKERELAHTAPEIKRVLKHSRPDRNAEAKAYGTTVCRSFLASKTARSLL
jgi:hypothetical protein